MEIFTLSRDEVNHGLKQAILDLEEGVRLRFAQGGGPEGRFEALKEEDRVVVIATQPLQTLGLHIRCTPHRFAETSRRRLACALIASESTRLAVG